VLGVVVTALTIVLLAYSLAFLTTDKCLDAGGRSVGFMTCEFSDHTVYSFPHLLPPALVLGLVVLAALAGGLVFRIAKRLLSPPGGRNV
jgi:hypothetical protein